MYIVCSYNLASEYITLAAIHDMECNGDLRTVKTFKQACAYAVSGEHIYKAERINGTIYRVWACYLQPATEKDKALANTTRAIIRHKEAIDKLNALDDAIINDNVLGL
jgi:hypothetical protein